MIEKLTGAYNMSTSYVFGVRVKTILYDRVFYIVPFVINRLMLERVSIL